MSDRLALLERLLLLDLALRDATANEPSPAARLSWERWWHATQPLIAEQSALLDQLAPIRAALNTPRPDTTVTYHAKVLTLTPRPDSPAATSDPRPYSGIARSPIVPPAPSDDVCPTCDGTRTISRPDPWDPRYPCPDCSPKGSVS